jgi:pSer/pThr/pTyr-binding forkhead associated (FHA) protein
VLSHNGDLVEETYLVPGRLIIGRTPDNDLQVDSRVVSRHHAQVVTTSAGSVIEDLNSTNGIFVRGKRVRRHRLAEGDVVQIGHHTHTNSRADAGATGTMTVVKSPDEGEEEERAEADEGSES